MIYSSTINGYNDKEAESMLENAEDRFEFNTIGEATMIVVGEQEQNWTNFMKGVGMDELASVMEGEEVVYEGARLQSFLEKAKGYFKMALNKLAEITKSFITKIDQFFRSNDSFVKKYESKLRNFKLPADFEFRGYNFVDSNLDTTPSYPETKEKEVTAGNAASIVSSKDSYSKEAAEGILVSESGDSFGEKLTAHFYGEKSKDDLKNISLGKQLDILKGTKDLKKKAKDSYSKAHKSIKTIIKKLETAQKKNLKDVKTEDLSERGSIDDAINVVLGYWKAYSSCVVQYHGAYMRALGARNRQAKAICAKAMNASLKEKGKDDRSSIKKSHGIKEGFVDTDTFLGAVEFI